MFNQDNNGSDGKVRMNTIKKFEDIVAWQRARVLTKEVYACTRVGEFSRDFGLKDQIQRASVSTMSNIAEGFDRGGDKEFTQFLSTSKGSCGEVKSHLYVALDQGYIPRVTFDNLHSQADEVGRLVFGFMAYLRESEFRGRKYK
jgi:four helix bundle protein